jgi:DNA-binding transcriptional LysR family regulator
MNPILSLDKLRTLLRLSTTSSFSDAASELGISQSAVSQQIKDLETLLGVTLINRNDRPIRPTEAGSLLIQYSHEIFGRLEEMERRIAEIREARVGKVIVGASTSVGSYLLPDLVAHFKNKYPDVEITAKISPRAWVYDDIKLSKTDFALVLAIDPPDHLHYTSLRAEALVFVCSPKHKLAQKGAGELRSIAKEKFVTAGQRTDYVIMSNEILKRHGVYNYPIAIELDSMEAVKRAVCLNMGIAFLPLLGVHKEIQTGEISRIRLKQSFECTLALVYRSEKFLTPAMKTFVDFCTEALLTRNPQKHR